MGRQAWEPTEEDLQYIKDMSAKGATQKEICKVLKISVNTFKKNKNATAQIDTQSDTINDIVDTPIKKAMQEGERIRRDSILSVAEDSLLESIKIRKQVETKTASGSNDNGSYSNTTVTEKDILPNPTILMFALVNATNAEKGKPISWQSINKVEVKQENNINNSDKPFTVVPDED